MVIPVSPLDPLIPVIIAVIKQSGFPTRWNALIALAIYVIWALLSLITGLVSAGQPLDINLVVTRLSIAVAVGYSSYAMFWKNMGEPVLEARTSFFKGIQEDPIVIDPPTSPGAPNAAG